MDPNDHDTPDATMSPTDANRDRATATESSENRPTETENRPTEMRSTRTRPDHERSTENRPTATESSEDRPPATVADISHRNPYTGETAGQIFNRGPIVRADGGRPATEPERTDGESDDAEAADGGPDAADAAEAADGGPDEADAAEVGEDDDAADRMRDVDHTPPKDAGDANRVFERGGREETVVSEE